MLEWVTQHPLGGPFLICAVTILVVLLMIPYTLLAVGSGYALSQAFDSQLLVVFVGTLAVFTGAWIGAMIAFVTARYILHQQVKDYSKRRPLLKAVDLILKSQGLKIIILLRLSMLVPFNISNFVFGASAVQLRHFAIGTLGMIPLVAFFVYLGTSVSDLHEVVSGQHQMSRTEIALMVAGTLFALIGLVFTSVMVKRALNSAR